MPEVDQRAFMALAHVARGFSVAGSGVLELWGKADLLCMQEVCDALDFALARSVTVDTCIGWLGYCMYLKQVESRALQVALAHAERVLNAVEDPDILLRLVQDDELAVPSEDFVLQRVLRARNERLLWEVRGGLLSAAALQTLASEERALVLHTSKAYDVRKGWDIPWQGVQAEVVTTTRKVTAMYASEAGVFLGYADNTLEMRDPSGNSMWNVSLKLPRQREDHPILAIFASGNEVICNRNGALRVLSFSGKEQQVPIKVGVAGVSPCIHIAVWNDRILHAHHDGGISAYTSVGERVWTLPCNCRGMQVCGDTVYFIQNVGSDSQRRGIFKSDLSAHPPIYEMVFLWHNVKDMLVQGRFLYTVDAEGVVFQIHLPVPTILRRMQIEGFVRPTGMLIASGSKLLCTHGAKEERLAVLDMNTLTTEHNFEFGEGFGMVASVPRGDVWSFFRPCPSQPNGKVMVWLKAGSEGEPV